MFYSAEWLVLFAGC